MSKEHEDSGHIVRMFKGTALTTELREMMGIIDEQFAHTFEGNEDQVRLMREQLGFLRRQHFEVDAFHLDLIAMARRIRLWGEAELLFGDAFHGTSNEVFPELISGVLSIVSIQTTQLARDRSMVDVFLDLDRVVDFRYEQVYQPLFQKLDLHGSTVSIRLPGIHAVGMPHPSRPYDGWFNVSETPKFVRANYNIRSNNPHPTISES